MVAELIPKNGKVDLGEESQDSLKYNEVVDLIDMVSDLTMDNKALQRVGLD